MPLRARVDEADGARRALAGDLDAADLVAQLERQLERNGREVLTGAEAERRLGQTLPARGNGMDKARPRGALRTQDARLQLAALPDAGGDTERLGAASILDDGEGPAVGERAQLVGNLGRLAVMVDVIAQPDDAHAGGAGEGAL